MRAVTTRSDDAFSISLCCSRCVVFSRPHRQEAEDEEEEKKLGWSNVADVGLVVTAGNSSTSTFSFDDKLTYAWEGADFIFRAGALRVQTTDDPVCRGDS